MGPDPMPLMRRQHEELGLNADLALAWHEAGHAIAASALGRLTCVRTEPCLRTYVDREGLNQNDDEWIAAMGPAAQFAYMKRFQNKEPSSCFLGQWFSDNAAKELRELSQRWPSVRLEEGEWGARILRFSRLIQQNRQVSGVLRLCAETLLQEKALSAEAVKHLARDSEEAILGMLSMNE